MPRLLSFVAAIVLAISMSSAQAQQGPVVAVAANVADVVSRIAERFRTETGEPLRVSSGASGNFYRQIVQGAPFELFLSADEEFALRLTREGFARDDGALYATGRLAYFVPEGS